MANVPKKCVILPLFTVCMEEQDKQERERIMRVCLCCDQEIDPRKVVGHVSPCFIAYCEEMGLVALCTCKSCRGRMTHPGDWPEGATEEQKGKQTAPEDVERIIKPPVKRQQIQPGEPLEEGRLLTKVLIGQICCLCDKHLSTAALPVPLIHVGRYHKFEVHMKKHLCVEEDIMRLHHIFNTELAFVHSTKDQAPFSILDESSQEDSQDQSQKEVGMPQPLCSGYDKKVICGEKTDSYLWVEDDLGLHYFCDPAHLTCYLQKEAKKGGKGKSGKTKKKKKKEKEKEKEKEKKGNHKW